MVVDDWEESCRERGGTVETIAYMGRYPQLQVCKHDGNEDSVERMEIDRVSSVAPDQDFRQQAKRVDGTRGIFAFRGDFYEGQMFSIEDGNRVRLEMENDKGEEFTVRYPSDHYFGRHSVIPENRDIRIHPRHEGRRKYDHSGKDRNPREWRFGQDSLAGEGDVRFERASV